MPPLLTIPELRERLRCGRDEAYSIAKQIGFQVGREWRICQEDLIRWQNDRKASTGVEKSGGGQEIPLPAKQPVAAPKILRRPNRSTPAANDYEAIPLTQPRKRSTGGR